MRLCDKSEEFAHDKPELTPGRKKEWTPIKCFAARYSTRLQLNDGRATRDTLTSCDHVMIITPDLWGENAAEIGSHFKIIRI